MLFVVFTGKRICKVDFVTCPEGVTVGEYDTCTDSAATPQQQQPAKSISYNQCKCRDEWWFAYGDGSVKSFSGCANPDDDPLGPWCAVDPAFCDNFAGEIKQTVNEVRGLVTALQGSGRRDVSTYTHILVHRVPILVYICVSRSELSEGRT